MTKSKLEFKEFVHVRIKNTNVTGYICDKTWNKKENCYLYTIEYDNPKDDELESHISIEQYKAEDLELLRNKRDIQPNNR
jgi:hypothetical protein